MSVHIPQTQIDELLLIHPRLASRRYRPTSLESPHYNCLAWAIHRDDLSLWPGGARVRRATNLTSDQQYWPPPFDEEERLETFLMFLGFHGYQTEVASGTLVDGREKVAVYIKKEKHAYKLPRGTVTREEEYVDHIARQLENGWWTSKMGHSIDIEHETAEELLGIDEDPEHLLLGERIVFLERERRPAGWAPPLLLPPQEPR